MSKDFKLKQGEIIQDRYTIKDFIGKGGMGSTYLAKDNKTKDNVALKVLSFSEVQDWKVLELFEREINALKNLDHPGIPDYVDNFEIDSGDEKLFFLVQEHVKGKDLYELIKSGKAFSLKEIKKIFESLLEILIYIHTIHPPIIHRDINPKNIVLDEKGKIYLVDFGAVGQIVTSTLAASMASTFVGTLGYMPPEQLYGKVSPASDIYSLGVTMIFMLSGKEPSEFKLKKMRINYHSSVNIPPNMKALLDKMISPDEESRISNTQDVLDILKKDIPLKQFLKGSTTDQLITELFNAEKEGKFAEIAETINNTLDVNAKNSDGRSILKIAFDQNRIQMAKFLIGHGADPNVKYKGKGILHDAVLMDKKNSILKKPIDFTELLLENGAEVDIKDNKNGKTPLEYAYDHKSADYKELFLKYGAKDTFAEIIRKGFSDLPSVRSVPFTLILKLQSILSGNLKKNIGKHIAIIVCLVILFLLAGFRILGLIRLWGTNTIAKGKVISVHGTATTVNDVPIYKYYFQFKDIKNHEYTNYCYTRGHKYGKGSVVKVEYINSNPNFSKIEGAWFTVLGNVIPLILTIPMFALIGIYISTWIIKNFIKYIRLLKNGIPTEANILKYKYAYSIDYFDEKKKIKRKGKSFFTDSDYIKNNSTVPALYFSGKPHYVMLIPPDFIYYKNEKWNLVSKEELIKPAITYIFSRLGLGGLVFFYFYKTFNFFINGV